MSSENAIFGQSCSYEKSRLILLGAPWEVTVSYASGTVHGPKWIQQASSQLDFFDPQNKNNPSNEGIYFHYLSHLKNQNDKFRPVALKEGSLKEKQDVNQACFQMVQDVRAQVKKVLDDEKLFGLIGGDHSVSEGALLEVGERFQGKFGILHFDAHADMRSAYQGFTHSHASVMHNTLQGKHAPCQLVQVGIRDLCKEEFEKIQGDSRIHCFFDHDIKKRLFEGKSWSEIVSDILKKLPEQIYISLDVDALSWEYAPHTGCPVPGGLSFDQMSYLIQQLGVSKKKIVGFDVVETARPPSHNFGEWDGNVSARLIYKLCGAVLF
ncbi:MAG: agmatinase family protein [Bdellovibrionales bacterium]|nr:agmatinase family protein [Bdellovibrionales bacterium]